MRRGVWGCVWAGWGWFGRLQRHNIHLAELVYEYGNYRVCLFLLCAVGSRVTLSIRCNLSTLTAVFTSTHLSASKPPLACDSRKPLSRSRTTSLDLCKVGQGCVSMVATCLFCRVEVRV